ncbi:hypothetical protein ACFX2F_002864 [Malus domestica]
MNTPRNLEGVFHRYGGNGHWACTCRTPKHLVDLYQASLKEKGVETNFLDQAKQMDIPDPIIKLRAQFPDYPIKSIRLDNVCEFTSQTLDDYCMTLGIDVEHSVPRVHTQNGLAEAFIKRLQLIARTLLMKTKLPVFTWGHAILHVASLVRLRPIANHQYLSIQLVFGHQPNISHLRVFGCVVYVPIAPPQRTRIEP